MQQRTPTIEWGYIPSWIVFPAMLIIITFWCYTIESCTYIKKRRSVSRIRPSSILLKELLKRLPTHSDTEAVNKNQICSEVQNDCFDRLHRLSAQAAQQAVTNSAFGHGSRTVTFCVPFLFRIAAFPSSFLQRLFPPLLKSAETMPFYNIDDNSVIYSLLPGW